MVADSALLLQLLCVSVCDGVQRCPSIKQPDFEGRKPAVDRYIDFLKAGSSQYPIDVLKKAGVDMTSPEPIEAACKMFEEKLR